MYSISEGYKNNIDPNIIGYWKNIRVVTGLTNDIKWTKCCITIENLLKLIKESEN